MGGEPPGGLRQLIVQRHTVANLQREGAQRSLSGQDGGAANRAVQSEGCARRGVERERSLESQRSNERLDVAKESRARQQRGGVAKR